MNKFYRNKNISEKHYQKEKLLRKYYITNAIPYVNAKPHIGHALEFVQSDVIKRFHKEILGENVLLLCGGDENAIKNVQAAEKENTPIQEFVDKNTQLFLDLSKNLNVNFDVFQKGSNKEHHKSSQKLWELCDKNGDIYKKTYTGLYCIGCELFYEKSELNKEGECFEHPGKPLEEVSEENYFFRLSKYQNRLKNLIESGEIEIIPQTRKNEVLSFINQGLEDISISRSNIRAKNWGVPVPEDNNQRMYVWFDALNIYQSGVGFGKDEVNYKKWWPADVHVIGKGIIRFHAVYWPAFLISAGLKLPKSIFVHGYFTIDGKKMSKSLGNVIDPIDMINKYGVDSLRYFLLREIPSTGDGDFSEKRLREVYNSDLANGLGNLVARVAKLCEKCELKSSPDEYEMAESLKNLIYKYKFNEALEFIWSEISKLDKKINTEEPWKLEEVKLKESLSDYVNLILQIASNLKPFLPETSKKILSQFSGNIKSTSALFPRLS